jgi:hypothetical protein
VKLVSRTVLVCASVASLVLACASEQPPIDDGPTGQPTSTNTATPPPPPTPPPAPPRDAGNPKQCPSTCAQDTDCSNSCQAAQPGSIWCCDKSSSKICFQYAPDGGSGCPTSTSTDGGPY